MLETKMDNINQRDSERRRHGLHRDLHTNGKLKCELNFVHGKIHGFFRSWYENGKPWYECYLEKGIKEGEDVFYNGNKNG